MDVVEYIDENGSFKVDYSEALKFKHKNPPNKVKQLEVFRISSSSMIGKPIGFRVNKNPIEKPIEKPIEIKLNRNENLNFAATHEEYLELHKI